MVASSGVELVTTGSVGPSALKVLDAAKMRRLGDPRLFALPLASHHPDLG
jgi:hypothetical protein